MISIDCDIADVVRCSLACSLRRASTTLSLALISNSCTGTGENTVVAIGSDKSSSTSNAASSSSVSRISTRSVSSRTPRLRYPIRSPRKPERASSTRASRRSRTAVSTSTSSNRCDPPCRSSPNTTLSRGSQSGSVSRTLCGKTFGNANSNPTAQTPKTRAIFHFVKYNIQIEWVYLSFFVSSDTGSVFERTSLKVLFNTRTRTPSVSSTIHSFSSTTR